MPVLRRNAFPSLRRLPIFLQEERLAVRRPWDTDVNRLNRVENPALVSLRVSPIADTDGNIIGAVETFSDNSSKIAALEKVEMKTLALIDPLTSVGNPRYTERILHEHCELFRREGESFAALFFDLDHFKTVNDSYSHAAGDAVLKAVARTILNNLRSFDYLGRWGGEEFIAVLAKADAARA